eukprot:scaffold40870_cov60-Phaeocystis_antarctica.AAC.2
MLLCMPIPLWCVQRVGGCRRCTTYYGFNCRCVIAALRITASCARGHVVRRTQKEKRRVANWAGDTVDTTGLRNAIEPLSRTGWLSIHLSHPLRHSLLRASLTPAIRQLADLLPLCRGQAGRMSGSLPA